MHLGSELHVVVAVDAKDFLHHVARAVHVHAVCRHLEMKDASVGGRLDADFKRGKDCRDEFLGEFFPYEAVAVVKAEVHFGRFHRFRI